MCCSVGDENSQREEQEKKRKQRMMSKEEDGMSACLRVMVVVECQMMLRGFFLFTFTSVSNEINAI